MKTGEIKNVYKFSFRRLQTFFSFILKIRVDCVIRFFFPPVPTTTWYFQYDVFEKKKELVLIRPLKLPPRNEQNLPYCLWRIVGQVVAVIASFNRAARGRSEQRK